MLRLMMVERSRHGFLRVVSSWHSIPLENRRLVVHGAAHQMIQQLGRYLISRLAAVPECSSPDLRCYLRSRAAVPGTRRPQPPGVVGSVAGGALVGGPGDSARPMPSLVVGTADEE